MTHLAHRADRLRARRLISCPFVIIFCAPKTCPEGLKADCLSEHGHNAYEKLQCSVKLCWYSLNNSAYLIYEN